MVRRRRVVSLAAVGATALSFLGVTSATHTAIAAVNNAGKLNCASARALCTEVDDTEAAFGEGNYVGHDEPTVEYYSGLPGAGNSGSYGFTLPKEPTTAGHYTPHDSYSAQLAPAFWFGMVMCDSQSYPEQNHSTCTPDSDSNIVNPANRGSWRYAPGSAYMELQFYPPGTVQQWTGFSCDASQWCAALTIDSLAEDPINGTTMNSTCANAIGSIEYVNFAFITTNGVPNGPPNPLQFNPATSGNPHTSGNNTLFMNQGDNMVVNMHDTSNGFTVSLDDRTTHQTGFMTASGSNGFAQVNYAPTGTSCTGNYYDFHPMYSSSSPATRALWAAAGYNIGMDVEIGHYNACSQLSSNATDGSAYCTGLEGNPTPIVGNTVAPVDQQPAESPSSPQFDDYGCFPGALASADSSWTQNYCEATNTPGFDGAPYEHMWPDGSSVKPTAFMFTSPNFLNSNTNSWQSYAQYAFNVDLPRNEIGTGSQGCNRSTGANCTNPPMRDDGTPANFYPFFQQFTGGFWSNCEWGLGDVGQPNVLNGYTHSSAEFGPLQQLNYWAFGGHGALVRRYNDFNSGLSSLTGACAGWSGG